MKLSPTDRLTNALEWCGVSIRAGIVSQMERFADLLVEEGIPAGVLGPNEAPKVWERHIIDSVCFSYLGRGATWLDVGSGGGLPGIPIAIALPDIQMTLLDRAGRRTEMTERWIRILDLENVAVIQADIGRYAERHDTLVFRGSLGLTEARETVLRCADRVGVFGLTHGGFTPPRSVSDDDIVVVPASVLDTSATLLRINP